MIATYGLAAVLLAVTCSSAKPGHGPDAASAHATATETAPATPIYPVLAGTARLLPAPLPIARTDDIRTFVWDSQSNQLYESTYKGSAGIWSPDSTRLAYRPCCDSSAGVQILELRTGASVQIQTGEVNALTWAPDGNRLIGTRFDGSIEVVGLDGSMEVLPGAGFSIFDFAWLTESIVAGRWSNNDGEERSVLIDLDKSTVTPFTSVSGNPSEGDVRLVFGVPNSNKTKIVFTEGGATYVWERNAGASTKVLDYPAGPEWAADGENLLLQYFHEGRPLPQTVIVNTSTWSSTSRPDVGIGAHWTSAGEIVHLGFHCRPDETSADTHEVTATSPTTLASRQLTHETDSLKYEAQPSPDRRYLAFTESFLATRRLLRLRVLDVASGAEALSVSLENDPHVHEGAWSPDGRYLRFWINGSHGICD